MVDGKIMTPSIDRVAVAAEATDILKLPKGAQEAKGIPNLPEGSPKLLAALAALIDTDNREIAERLAEIQASVLGLTRWLGDRVNVWKEVCHPAPRGHSRKGKHPAPDGMAAATAKIRIRLLADLSGDLGSQFLEPIEIDEALRND